MNPCTWGAAGATDTCLIPPETSEVLETGWPTADRGFQGSVAMLGLADTQVQGGKCACVWESHGPIQAGFRWCRPVCDQGSDSMFDD